MRPLGDEVRRGLPVYALGKVVTAVSSIGLLLLLARALSTAEYATYIALQGLILLIGAVTSFGINQAVIRYLPELMANGHRTTMFTLIWRSLLTRAAVTSLAFFGFGLWLFLSPPAWLPADSPQAILVYQCVGAVRIVGFFLSRAMESMLWQRFSQLTMASAALAKLVGAAMLAAAGALDLQTLALLELGTELLLVGTLIVVLRLRQRLQPSSAESAVDWLSTHRDRLRHYGRWNYLATMVGQLSTTNPWRLAAGALFAVEQAAALGFALAITDLLYRFLPVNMGRVLVRSVAVAKTATGRSLTEVATMLNLSLRMNIAILAVVVAVFWAGQEGLAEALAGGRFGQAGVLVAGLAAVLMLDAVRLHLELFAEVVERPRLALLGNLPLAAGLVAGAWLAPMLGLWAVVAGAAAGQVMSILAHLPGLLALPVRALADMRLLTTSVAALAGGVLGSSVAVGTWPVQVVLAGSVASLSIVLTGALRPTELRVLVGRRQKAQAAR